MNKKISILFVGNSYTNYNSLILCFKHMCEKEGIDVDVKKVAYGYQFLHNYTEGTEGTYFNELREILNNYSFDYCFLQEFSRGPIINTDDFYSSTRKLFNYLKSFNIVPIMYQTWGYPEGYQSLMESIGCLNTIDMAKKLAYHYETIADKLNIKVSPAGSAFLKMYLKHKDNPSLLYTAIDNSHPSRIGTYLATLCHFAKVFNKKVANINYKFNDYLNSNDIIWHCNKSDLISDELQKDLEDIANEAVFGESITKDYEI